MGLKSNFRLFDIKNYFNYVFVDFENTLLLLYVLFKYNKHYHHIEFQMLE